MADYEKSSPEKPEKQSSPTPPSPDNKGGGKKGAKNLAKGAVAAAQGAAVAVKGVVALKVILTNVATWITVLVVIILVALMIVAITGQRTIDHAKKYGCGSGEMNDDLISLLDPKSLYDLGKWFQEDEEDPGCGKAGGAGFNGDFYPPTPGVLAHSFGGTQGWRPVGHTGEDISLGGGRSSCDMPIFAYAGGEATNVVMGGELSTTPYAPIPPSQPQGHIRLKHQEGFETTYDHTRGTTTTVRPGDIVSAGDEIAKTWDSGWSIGCHLHFEVWLDGHQTDPLAHMKKTGIYELYPIMSLDALPPKPEGTGDGGGDPTAPASDLQKYAKKAMKTFGWTKESELQCLVKLWNRESNWRYDALNPAFAPSEAAIPENQAYGIPQAGPGRKMVDAGSDWKTNPQTQIRWGLGYIQGRYGTPCGAWAHSEAVNWY